MSHWLFNVDCKQILCYLSGTMFIPLSDDYTGGSQQTIGC